MTSKLKKVRLKGNESFNFREGWLRKGMRCVEACPELFAQSDVMERLGVGSKMVKSIRFWLQAASLCGERPGAAGRGRLQVLTEDFGKVVRQWDPYFDDPFTLFLLHYHIVSNASFCMMWNIFFNEYEGQDFTKEDMTESCKALLAKKMDEGCSFSERSLADDCSSILRMYIDPDNAGTHPEDSLACPLAELGLLQKSTRVKNAYVKAAPSRDLLDKSAVLYVTVKNLQKGKTSVSIGDLLNAPNHAGRVFNLNRVAINEYLDQLRISGHLSINRTAGLDMVYVTAGIRPEEIMVDYYKKIQVR